MRNRVSFRGYTESDFMPRPVPTRQETSATLSNPSEYKVPEEGGEVVVGVLIALPSQGAAGWEVDEDDDAGEVPEVCLGLVDCHVQRD